MTDVLLFWRDYRKNEGDSDAESASSADESAPWRWYSNARLVGNLEAGDRLWMIGSGAGLGRDPEQAGYLVAIWIVKRVHENTGDAPEYPRERYRFAIEVDPSRSIPLEEPVLVDHVLRPYGRDKAVAIGRFLQGPRKLDDEKVRLLRAAAGAQLALNWLKGSSAVD